MTEDVPRPEDASVDSSGENAAPGAGQPKNGADAEASARAPDIKLAWLLEPLSEDAPCGPDPEVRRDLGVQDYVAAAQMRLPKKYVNIDSYSQEVTLFDASTIDLPGERQTAFEVLRRVRDLRVLVTLARFEAVCGDFAGFSDCLEAAAAVIAAWPEHVHPHADDAGATLRKPLALLDNPATVRNPFYYTPLNGQRDMHYRNYMKAQKGDHPDGLDGDAFVARVGQGSHAQKREKLHAELRRVQQAFAGLKTAFGEATGGRLDDAIKGIGPQIDEMVTLLESADPDLAAAGLAPADGTDATDTAASTPRDADPQATGTAQSSGANTSAVVITSRDEARAALEAVEVYLSSHEPSSLSLVLVEQARALIGRPLIEAFSTLAQSQTGSAAVRFEDDLPFQLNWDQLKRLTEQALQKQPKPNSDTPPQPVEFPEVENRDQISPILRGVEIYLKKAEISSPVPLLLSKARSFLSKDFTQVFKELTKRNS